MHGRTGAIVALILLTLASCGPGGGRQSPTGREGSSEGLTPPVAKLLRVAILTEPNSFVGAITGLTTTTGGAQQPTEIAHNWLTLTDANSEPQPALAVELPSLEKGTWRVLPDGTMETTWKLRSNVKWHDGEAFTADDLVFGLEVRRDPAMPIARAAQARLVTVIETPDPLTAVLKWRQVYAEAQDMGRDSIEPLPRHILEDVFRRDKDAFINSPYWSTDFVGLGPFRLVRWEPGSHVEFARFDGYYRGPARLTGIILKFIPDPNTQVSTILADEVDVVLPVGISMDQASLVKERWAGTANRVLVGNPQRIRFLSHQGRAEDLKQPALADPRVRRALYQGVDRPQLVEAVLLGLGEVADSFIPPNHSYRKDVETSIPQYPFDPAAATRGLAEAGWIRGADGALRNQAAQPLGFQIQATRNARSEKEVPIIADGWRQLGAEVEERLLPPAIIRDAETWHRFPGMEVIAQLSSSFWNERIHSREIAGPQNRWNGSNFGGYANPTVDEVVDRLALTIPRTERAGLMRELVRAAMTDLAVMPLFWDPDAILALGKVKNLPMPSAITQVHTWNVFEWDLEG